MLYDVRSTDSSEPVARRQQPAAVAAPTTAAHHGDVARPPTHPQPAGAKPRPAIKPPLPPKKPETANDDGTEVWDVLTGKKKNRVFQFHDPENFYTGVNIVDGAKLKSPNRWSSCV